jgi:hypothetical protein
MATNGQQTRWNSTMRIPIILALIVIITLPKDIQGLADDVSTQISTANVAVSQFLGRSDEPVQVAEARADANVPKVMNFSVR